MPRRKRKRAIKLARTLKRKCYCVLKHRAIRELFICLLIVAVLYFGITGVLILALQTGTPLLAVESDSMKPTFERGDLLIIRGIDDPTREDAIRENDIVIYEARFGRTIVHRVVVNERTNEWRRPIDGTWEFWIKGDAPTAMGEWVRADQIKGKVIFWIPKLGYISLWVRGA